MKVWWLEVTGIPPGTTSRDIVAHTDTKADYFNPTTSRICCNSYEDSQHVLRFCNYKKLNGSTLVFTRTTEDLRSCRKAEIVNIKKHIGAQQLYELCSDNPLAICKIDMEMPGKAWIWFDTLVDADYYTDEFYESDLYDSQPALQGLINDFRSGVMMLDQTDDREFHRGRYRDGLRRNSIDVASDSGSDVIVIDDDADLSDCQILEVADSEAPLPSVAELLRPSQNEQHASTSSRRTYLSQEMVFNIQPPNRSMGTHVNPEAPQAKRPLSGTTTDLFASSAKKQHRRVSPPRDETPVFGSEYEIAPRQNPRVVAVGSARLEFRKIEDSDDDNTDDSDSKPMRKTRSSVAGLQSNSSTSLANQPADAGLHESSRRQSVAHAARKSTGGKHPKRRSKRRESFSVQSSRGVSSSASPPPTFRSSTRLRNPSSRVAPADSTRSLSSTASKGRKKGAKTAQKKNGYASDDDTKVPQDILDAMKVSEACLNQPFLYDFFHAQLPCEADGIGSHCLSMAWQPAEVSRKSDSLDFFISQGAQDSVAAALHGPDATEVEEFSTCLFRCTVDIQRQLFRYTSPTLSVNSLPSSSYDDSDTNTAVDRNFKPVTQLKLYDQGRVMFGCSMSSLMVWVTETMKHSHSLLLIDDINDVYDVGKDYVVAGSGRGDVGVWKAGSKSHLWRFNDARRFENSRKTGYMSPEVSALRISYGDDCAYVGDSLGSLSVCDFREPRIKTVSPIDRGGINSIDIIDNRQILVGTEKGIIATLDSRMMGGSHGTKVLSVYTPDIADTVRSIQVNPHNSSVIACSGYEDIRIYRADPIGDLMPVFTHSLHQSVIADYSWHPNSEHKYTIGSLDTGEGFDTGEIQIWQPTMAKDW